MDNIRRCNRCMARFLCLGTSNHIYCAPCVHQWFNQNKECPPSVLAVPSAQDVPLSAEELRRVESSVVAVCKCDEDVEEKLKSFKSMFNRTIRDPRTIDISLLK